MSNATATSDTTVLDAPTDGFVVASAPAGWYDIGDGMRRWFDGRGWTDYLAPVLTLATSSPLVASRYSTAHGFHVIMLVMTLGAWMPVWVGVIVCNRIRSTAPRD